jgi:RNA polymerase sigma-70 factor, ECF subfamily
MRSLAPPAPQNVPLLARAAEGEPAALAELFAQHAADVHRIAYRLTRSAADADDVLQDVFVGLPEALRGFRGRGSFAGWLARVAVRTALMRMRAHARRREVPLDGAHEPSAGHAGQDVVDRAALENALATLPDALRTVFVLREMEGYTHAEIGTLLGIRPGTSEVRLFRAKHMLRTLLRSPR